MMIGMAKEIEVGVDVMSRPIRSIIALNGTVSDGACTNGVAT